MIIRLTEAAICRMVKKAITNIMEGTEQFRIFTYFGNCKDTVDVDGMWDATEMQQFVDSCLPIQLSVVVGKLRNGDRPIPNELITAIQNNPSDIQCGISQQQRIMFIYLYDNDTHYFFDCA